MKRKFNIVVIGGSAGSYSVVRNILSSLPTDFPLPIMLCLHRLRDAKSGLCETLNSSSNIKVTEPDDKTNIQGNTVYLAPSNYHMLFENTESIVLTVDEEVNYSRPSIDITFESAANNFKSKMIGILLSGANSDGANGLHMSSEYGAYTIVQKPSDALFSKMPEDALSKFDPDVVASEKEIIELILSAADISHNASLEDNGLSNLSNDS